MLLTPTSEPQSVIFIGDYGQVITLQIVKNGAPVNLTGADETVVVSFKRKHDTAVNLDFVINNHEHGEIRRVLSVLDFTIPGAYSIQAHPRWGNDAKVSTIPALTSPQSIVVKELLG